MSADISQYTGLITSEHADKSNFVATVAASVQPLADILATLNGMPTAFDIDNAVDAQLDIVGQWVGITRYVKTPLTGLYFSFDALFVGWDQGLWLGPGDPTAGLTAMPDDIYRLMLKAKIAANQWDGTIPGAYAAWDQLFAAYGFEILIQDNGDMTMILAITGAFNNPAFQDLFSGGYFDLRPAGVLIEGYLYPSANAPFFGFDVENSAISGFDVGAWGVSSPLVPGTLMLNGSSLLFNGDNIFVYVQ